MAMNHLPLPPVSPETLAAFETQRTAIVQATVVRCLANPQDVAQHGDQAERLLTAGLDFTTQAIGVAMRVQSGELLDQQLQWGNERLPHDGVAPTHLLSRLQILAAVIDELLSPAHAQVVNQYVQRMIADERTFIAADPV